MFNLESVAIERSIFRQEGQETSFVANVRVGDMNTEEFPIKSNNDRLEID